MLNRPSESIVITSAEQGRAAPRSSEILRGILTKNPGVKAFSVERILAAIGSDRFEASLMLFSLPALVPVPAPKGMAALPTTAIACQMASGRKQIRLPQFVLKKTVSRRALAVAIHAILPVLEAAEKVVRPRWSWIMHPTARRALGLFVFLLALAVAFPVFGFSPLHATSIFVMALGMAEQDGLAVLIGVAVGMLSFAVLAASGMSARAVREKAVKWLRKVGRKLGLGLFARFLRRHGYERIARLLTLEWSRVLLLWNPEQQSTAARARQPARKIAGAPAARLAAA